MGKFTRTKNPIPPKSLEEEAGWVDGIKQTQFMRLDSCEYIPPSPEQALRQSQACARIMAKRFGVKDWHRKVLTPDEISQIEKEV